MSRTAIVDELFTEFSRRHGGRPVRDGGRYLFPDGASCDQSDRWRNEPDERERDRLPIVHRYWTLRVEMAERDFKRWHRAMIGLAGPVNSRDLETPDLPRDLPDELSLLEYLAAALKADRSELAKVNEILNPPPSPEDRERQRRQRLSEELSREEAEQQQRERAERVARIVKSVEEGTDDPPPAADPKAMKLLPGKAVTFKPAVADPYDLSINQAPE